MKLELFGYKNSAYVWRKEEEALNPNAVECFPCVWNGTLVKLEWVTSHVKILKENLHSVKRQNWVWFVALSFSTTTPQNVRCSWWRTTPRRKWKLWTGLYKALTLIPFQISGLNWSPTSIKYGGIERFAKEEWAAIAQETCESVENYDKHLQERTHNWLLASISILTFS